MRVSTRTPQAELLSARNAVLATFFLNGFGFATWASRIPSVRHALDLGPARLGLLLLAVSVGAVFALPATGGAVQRFGARRVVTFGAAVEGAGLLLVGLGAGVLSSVPLTAVGLLLVGFGNGSWDVSMNVEGAEVERRLGRSIMPRFHASFSLGTVAGAGVGTLATALDLGIAWHTGVAAVIVAALGALSVRRFLPVAPVAAEPAPSHALRAWTEPRTLMIGVTGTALLDRFGRQRVLWGSMGVAFVGVLLVVLGQASVLVTLGIVLWGLGASLGFPVGMSAAADDPAKAAARVSVVSTIGYLAFLGGPPLVGFLGSHVGVLHALLLVAVVLVPSALAVPAAREPAGR